MQTDDRWSELVYCGGEIAETGCGPMCLSMACYYLTGNEDMLPQNIIEFASENKYYEIGVGTLWSLMIDGAEKLGFTSNELPLSENCIYNALKNRNPIICSVGPGDFTTTGHFIVLTGYVDGKLSVNDPNSLENSEKLWEYDEIKDQIKNLWEISI